MNRYFLADDCSHIFLKFFKIFMELLFYFLKLVRKVFLNLIAKDFTESCNFRIIEAIPANGVDDTHCPFNS